MGFYSNKHGILIFNGAIAYGQFLKAKTIDDLKTISI